jgi:transcription elongation factor
MASASASVSYPSQRYPRDPRLLKDVAITHGPAKGLVGQVVAVEINNMLVQLYTRSQNVSVPFKNVIIL